MFSVPGWNVSAPIAAQTEQAKPQDPTKLGKKALKRKRAQEEQQVNTEDLGKLWDKAETQRAEAQKAAEQPKDSGLPARALERAAEDDAEAAAAEGEKKSKKRKRGPRKNAATKEAAAAKAAEAAADGQAAPAPPGPKAADPESKRSKKKQKKEKKARKADDAEHAEETDAAAAPAVPVPALMDPVALIPEPAGLTALQKSMRSKLASARFRHLNESLYTKPSADSLSLFREDPSMFEDYHRGFAQQVEVWPQNPVDDYVASILARGSIKIAKDPWRAQMREKKKKGPAAAAAAAAAAETQEDEVTRPVIPRGDNKPLPRTHGSKCLIADLGCGVASLSYRLQPHLQPLNVDIKSFDLSQPSGPSKNLVTVADISSLPLKDNSTDVAIFCLALMGTNWLDFIDEAYRVLRWKGELWVAEIKSRFGRVEKKKAVPINSIGSLNKGAKPPKKKGPKEKKKDDAEGIEDSADEAELAQTVDGASGPEGTDVSAFVDVLRTRGFVLDALPERPGDAIDLSNKMFVKLQFVKGAQPTKGKNAGTEGTSAGAKGSFKTSSALKMGIKGKKFNAVKQDEDDELSARKDASTLKPCLYKIR